jgi:hypothetical protein
MSPGVIGSCASTDVTDPKTEIESRMEWGERSAQRLRFGYPRCVWWISARQARHEAFGRRAAMRDTDALLRACDRTCPPRSPPARPFFRDRRCRNGNATLGGREAPRLPRPRPGAGVKLAIRSGSSKRLRLARRRPIASAITGDHARPDNAERKGRFQARQGCATGQPLKPGRRFSLQPGTRRFAASR